MPKIFIVDAFVDKPFSGNPAAVMIVPDFPIHMQQIAAEMSLSETAFVKPLSSNMFHLRWFTPKTEVKLCGHATLASAQVLFEMNYVKTDVIEFETISGLLRATRSKDGITLDFPLQPAGGPLAVQEIAPLVPIDESDVISIVSAFDDIIIELCSEATLRALSPDFHTLAKIDARGVIVTARGDSCDFVSRFFAPRVGVSEDPVTGSAHCKLAYYWNSKLRKDEGEHSS
jgi:PhzF family phenazine biosynthesis protein